MLEFIPAGWSCVTADIYCSSVRDGTHDSPKFHDDGYPLVTSKNIKGGTLDLRTVGLISNNDFEDINRRSKVDQWDVLYSMIGTVGEVYLIEEENPDYAIKNVGLFKSKTEEDGRWLAYWLQTPQAKQLVYEKLRGASQQYIPLGDLRKLLIPMPSDDIIRRQIMNILSSYDNLIAVNKRRIQLLEESARLLYRERFVQLRFPGHDAVNVNDGVPEGWSRKPLGEYAALNYGKSLNATNRTRGEFPVYGSSGIVGYHNKPLIDGPGIIVGRKGTVGSVYYSHCPCCPIDTVYFISSEQTSYFLYIALQDLNFISSDAAVPGLNRNYAYSLQLLVPSTETFSAFETTVQPIFEQINTLITWNGKLSMARDLLLPKLMSGALDVSRIAIPEEITMHEKRHDHDNRMIDG